MAFVSFATQYSDSTVQNVGKYPFKQQENEYSPIVEVETEESNEIIGKDINGRAFASEFIENE